MKLLELWQIQFLRLLIPIPVISFICWPFYQSVYGDFYNSYSDILRSPYDEIVVPYFNGNNTTLGMGSLNNHRLRLFKNLLWIQYYRIF